MAKYNYRCSFCGLGFVHEDRFMKHKCKPMIRDEEIRTPLGIAAHSHYQQWMKLQKRMVPNVESFLSSKLYASFMKFAKFAQDADIPNTEHYIKYMIRNDIPPSIWTNDGIYHDYLQWLDKGKDPRIQALYTANYICDVAEALKCDTGEVFDYLQPNDVITMLKKRLLSPWILLRSSKFRDFINKKTTTEQRMHIETIIKPTTWIQKQKDNPEIVKEMKEIVRELNL